MSRNGACLLEISIYVRRADERSRWALCLCCGAIALACMFAHSLSRPSLPSLPFLSLPSIYVPIRTSPPRSRSQRPHVFFLSTAVPLELPGYTHLSLSYPPPRIYVRDSGDTTFLLPQCHWRYPDSYTFLLPPRTCVCTV